MSNSVYIIPFGKFKGNAITEVPTEYLVWLEEEKVADGENTSSPILVAIKEELRRRK